MMRKKEWYRKKSSELKGPEMGMGLASLRHEMKLVQLGRGGQGWNVVGPDVEEVDKSQDK